MTRLLIAMDESPQSPHAARVAAALFPDPANEFLVINVAAVPVPWIGGLGMFGEVGVAQPMLWAEHSEEIEEAQREGITAQVAEAGLEDADVLVGVGDPVAGIIRAADEHDVDLIVVGSHSKNFLARLIDPSVAEGVVHRTHRPVLVVPAASTST